MDESQLAEVFGAVQVERVKWFQERYDIIASGHLIAGGKRIYLGERDNRVCRYCGRAKPATTFKKTAHAFPEQTGNKILIDNCECDHCNEHFANMLEDDFAKWTMPLRTIGRVKGKSGAPSHKTADETLRIDAPKADELRVTALRDDPRYTVDDATRTITFRMERQPYVPMGVFKCMVKMALAVMPPGDAVSCAHLKTWILEPKHTFESYPYQPLNVIFQAIPGPLRNEAVTYSLLRRIAGRTDIPHMIFVLHFSNALLQITLPMPVEDEAILAAGTCDIALYPHAWGHAEYENKYGRSHNHVADLSATSIVKDDVVEMRMGYDQRVKVEPAAPSG
jgi:HNH endonuclease